MMRPDRVFHLARFHGSRLGRNVGAVAAAFVITAGIDVHRHGLHLAVVLPWLLGATGVLPLMQGFLVLRDKFDGSLRFLASLPVAGEEHAAARALLCIALAAPVGVVTWFALGQNAPMFTAGQAVVVSLIAWIGLGAGAVLLTAVQMRTEAGQGAKVALWLIVGAMVLTNAVPAMFGPKRWAALGAALLTRAGFAAASTVFWLALAAATWWAWQTIARISESYQAEGAKPL
jgi:hypothetical protein